MKVSRHTIALLCALALGLAGAAPPARADFGIKDFSVATVNEDGSVDTLAGSHPYEYTVHFEMNQDAENRVEGTLSELAVDLPPGLVGNPLAVPRCSRADFVFNLTSTCPGSAQLGTVDVEINRGAVINGIPLYNLTPSPGSAATLGTHVDIHNAVQEASVRSGSDYGVAISAPTLPTVIEFQSVSVHVWGLPMASVHDAARTCIPADPERAVIQGCASDAPPVPFLTLPTSCTGPLRTTLRVYSVQEPGVAREASVLSTNENEEPVGLDGCNQLQFEPSISAQPTTDLADSPSGLDFNLHQPQEPPIKEEPGQREHRAGQTEICQVGSWEGRPTAFTYQWLGNGTPIPGAESKQYVVEEADAGSVLQCEVTASNAFGEGHAAAAAAVVSPAPNALPPGAETPVVKINGTGGSEEATCAPGAWSGGPSFAYRWLKNGVAVAGQTTATYLNPGPPPYFLQCEVIGTNAAGAVAAFSRTATAGLDRYTSPPISVGPPAFAVAWAGIPRATAPAKDITVTLPAGIALNPSAANGLGACSEEQIGYRGGVPGVHFSESAQSCPDASKLGTVEVSSPLVDHKLAGGVYLAAPYQNPFGSFLAIYLAIEDPATGIVAKLAGRQELDPQSGQITAVFTENPQLPIEDVDLHLFNGPEAALRTPLECGTYTTTSTLTPWSAPAGADAHPASSFATSGAAGGSGPCPSAEAEAPDSPSFTAGTVAPQAGAYSPFVLKLARPDGSQRLTGLDVTLPEGLTGKLAGIPYCSEAQVAAAESREAPNQGALEQRDPSCPAASEVGSVTVGAGAGIAPLYVSGHAYLAGPYKGAPLSMVVIVPAVAGPFDLGTVVSRVALYVGEYDARIHAVSDPLPTILDGIPLDVRSIQLKLDRPGFTLNPTSCEAAAIEGSVTTQAGQTAPLNNRFQVGECARLGFKPKLSLSLKGKTTRAAHPALKAVVTMPPGGANLARIQVGLPHSEFLDQSNLRQVCTQGELKSRTCPPEAVYGHVRVWTPLIEKPLEGPVYLGVGFGYQLPALVAELNGQIRLLSAGRVDTTKQDGLRNTFETVPDAPVEKIVLEMKGGPKYGLLRNSENLCDKPQRARASFTAANGKVLSLSPKIANSCKGKKGRGGRHKKPKR
jgi:hypothetical protein